MDSDAVNQTVESLECEVLAIVPVLPLKSTVLFPLHVVSVQVSSKPNLLLLEEYPDTEEIVAAGVFLDPEGSYARRNLGSTAVADQTAFRRLWLRH